MFVITEPDSIKRVLLDNHKNYQRDYVLRRAHAIFGNGLLASHGESWLRNRRLMQPMFHRAYIESYAAIMIERIGQKLSEWVPEREIVLYDELAGLTAGIAVRTLFGSERLGRGDNVLAAITAVARYLSTPLFLLFPAWIPTPAQRRYMAGVRALDALIYAIVAERRDAANPGTDLLSLLLAAQDRDGSRMNDRQVRDELVSLFVAGHETTSTALSFVPYLMQAHPEEGARVLDEIASVIGDRPPVVADLPRLVHMDRFLKELLRLHPPLSLFGRESFDADDIAGHRVHPRAQILIPIFLVHRDPRHFPDPDRFFPDRWTPEFEKGLHKFAYLPFGAGPRVCIGASLADMEMKLALAMMLRRYRFEPLERGPLRLKWAVTVKPHDGMRVRLRAR
jgi:cytochrome P450